MSYTKKNLRDVEDAAVRYGLADSQEARQFEADTDGLELLIFGHHVEGDVEQVPDFWTS